MTTPNLSSDALVNALEWRYATKIFDPTKQIPADVWAALEKALVLTPSSFGLQPWRFFVIDTPEVRAELRPHAWGQSQITDASKLVVLAAKSTITEADVASYAQEISSTRGVPVESLAPLTGMISGFLTAMTPGSHRVHEWAVRQVYIALGNLMTAAAVVGVDVCPIEGFSPAEFDRVLKLPEQGYNAAVVAALGYRAADDKYATLPKVRRAHEQIVQHI